MVDFIVGILNSIGSGVGDDLVADLLKTPPNTTRACTS